MKKHSWKKIGCLFLAMLMMATMLATGVVGFTNHDELMSQKGSIIITKYEHDENTYNPGLAGNGEKITDSSVFDGYTLLKDVEFSLYKVEDTFTVEPNFDAKTYVAEHDADAKAKTNENGVATFSELDLFQRYLIIETDAPVWVTNKTTPFCVDLPMTSEDGNKWLTDVYVYPKNEGVRGSVEMTKVGEGDDAAKLQGAIFGLYQVTDGVASSQVFALATPANPVTDETSAYYNNPGYTVSDADGKVSFTNVPVGEYILKEVQAPAHYTLSNATYSFTIEAKNKDVKLTETAKNYKQLDVTAFDKADGTAVGARTINWTITAPIPTDIDKYQNYYITDTLPSELTYDAKSLKVTLVNAGGTESVLASEKYTFDANAFTVDFKNALTDLKGNASLKITFSTTLKENIAEENLGVVTNSATLYYQAELDTQISNIPDTGIAKIYGLNVNKTTLTGTGLPGASFRLYLNEIDAVTANDNYIYEVTNANASHLFSGLNAGTYWLVETDAPQGYAKLQKPVKVIINANDNDYMENVTIINTKNVSLPITGGIGTLIFTFSGIALMGAAVLLYIRSRRKSSAQA